MIPRFRLRIVFDPETSNMRLVVAFAEPLGDGEAACAPAHLETDDGQIRDLGILCSPASFDWRNRREMGFALPRALGRGASTAHFHWNDVSMEVPLKPETTASPPDDPGHPEIQRFSVKEPADRPLQRHVVIQVAGLSPDHRLRLDGDVGEVHHLAGGDGAGQQVAWNLNYPKPGRYTVTLDLLDADGFWLATMAKAPIEISVPDEFVAPAAPSTTEMDQLSAVRVEALPVEGLGDAQPWLPYRYARPAWNWSNAYTSPGGTQVSRSLGTGHYLSIHGETVVGGALWYQTGSWDWVPASSVTLMQPSTLRGVVLHEPSSPPPTPPPAGSSRGVVTASTLNVRARPGVSADNPPIAKLHAGDEVTIYDSQLFASDTWYRIGDSQWVHAGYIRLGDATQPPPPQEPPPQEPPPSESPPADLPRGVVTASTLNVRGQPGVREDNPPIAKLHADDELVIYEAQTYGGATWFRIGDNRWVHGDYVRVLPMSQPPPQEPPAEPPPADLPRGVVTTSTLNVRAQPGVRADNPPIAKLHAGDEILIHEEQNYGGVVWFRIGDDRWVQSDWIRLIVNDTRQVRFEASAADAEIRLPVGWVVAARLDTYARPGVADDNPPTGQVTHNQVLSILESRFDAGATWHRIGENRWVDGTRVGVASARSRPTNIGASERWVGVSLQQQTLVAYEGDRPVYATLTASGLPGTPTVQGVFRTWRRLPTGKMSGGNPAYGSYYYLEDVTWTCYFYAGYALHTAYWHDQFGQPRSHGCVNLSPYDAWWIYQWSEPGGPSSPAVYVYW